MIKSRKILAILLFFVLICGILPFDACADSIFTEGIFTFEMPVAYYHLIKCDTSASGDIVIPDSVSRIKSGSFSGCDKITSITVPDSVTDMEDGAFKGCNNLTTITLPYIGAERDNNDLTDKNTLNYLFGGDVPHSLKTLIISNTSNYYPGRIAINVRSFEGGDNISSVYFGDSVETIDIYAFNYLSSLTQINVSPLNDNYSSDNGVLFNKNKNKLLRCPKGKTGNYSIPDSVTSIGDYAFNQCINLENITIPQTVTKLGFGVFSGCHSLVSISIPKGVTSISRDAFFICSNLTSVTIPNSITSIEYSAFCGCYSLTDVYYLGSEEEWNKISVASYNECLLNSDIHYLCSHKYENAVCTICGAKNIVVKDIAPSKEPTLKDGKYEYAEYVFSDKNATEITLIIPDISSYADADTSIYILDADGTELGNYTPDELNSQSVTINSSTVILRIVSSDKCLRYNAELVCSFNYEKGDVDGDFSIGASDLVSLRKYLLGSQEIKKYQQNNANLNSDNSINILDLVLLKKATTKNNAIRIV